MRTFRLRARLLAAGATLAASILVPSSVLAGEPSCEDVGDIDFGPCDAVLGVGVIEGDCVVISGCESPVPLFVTILDCLSTCIGPTCDNLAEIDFGDCEAILGWGVIGDGCQLIVGCESPVPLFPTEEACEAACGVIPEETRSWGHVKARYSSD